MFRYRILALVLIVAAWAALAATAAAQREAHVSSARQDPLHALAYLLDGTWTASGDIPGFGKFETVRTYERVLASKFIDFHQTSRVGANIIEVRGMIGVHPQTKKITAWGFSSDGAITITDCDCAREDVFVFAGRLVGNPQAGPVRGTFRRAGADRFVETVERQVDGTWQVTFELAFQRSSGLGIPEARGATPDSGVRELEPLVGRWEMAGESQGQNYRSEFDFHWAVGGRFLVSEYRIIVSGPGELHAVSFMGRHPEEGLVQYGFSADGPVFTAKIAPGPDGRLLFDGEMNSGSRRQRIRITYRRISADELETSTEMWRNGAFQHVGTAVMKRAKP